MVMVMSMSIMMVKISIPMNNSIDIAIPNNPVTFVEGFNVVVLVMSDVVDGAQLTTCSRMQNSKKYINRVAMMKTSGHFGKK